MSLSYPHFQINFKIYPETWGEGGLALAETIERVGQETGANFVVTPQIPDVRLIARETDLPVFAPAVDPVEPGRGMGTLLPEALTAAGAVGAIINHAENRDTLADIETKIDRCEGVGLESVVCVDSVEMGRAVAAFEPDQLLFERPGDIATDRAISRSHPDRIEAFLEMRDAVAPETKVRVGGGVSTAEDVRLAFELGVAATGAASAIATAKDPEGRLRAIGEVLADRD
ncbi:Triosephosphate isomerase protein [Halorhabdus tiamatea SARL4B]|uniref:Triosephosphate isomerase n=1 Tax=Halorhabdus tiamatea SARL4B TaxID=1033806 RepID=F7PF04_9EURY|nr:triose-phosphate isomerase [Halorhabdus tiamatea]ERJ04847.1 Triosephosphate isomerase protein [Halorhabdus tiamatea SARL4B]CCQ32854.1 triosephosphate isomerase [Halorhabdus tiamatea SARL4B]